MEERRIRQGQGGGGQRTPELLGGRLLLLLLLLLGRLLLVLSVQGRGLGAGGGEDPVVGEGGHVADVDAGGGRRGHRGGGMGRVEDHAALQHVATVRVVFGLVVTRRTSGGRGARRSLILRLLVMVVSMIPARRRTRFIVLRGRLFQG